VKKYRKLITVLLTFSLLAGIAYFLFFRNNPPRNFQTCFYDWQPKKEINQIDKALLLQESTGTIFLKLGSFDVINGQLTFQREANWKTLRSYEGIKIDACYRLEYHFAETFGKMDISQVSEFLRAKITADINDAEAAGATLSGIHLDLDCPASYLPQYTQILRSLREGLGSSPQKSLSITVLPSWLFSPFKFHSLLKEIDFYVPLFFGYGINHTFQDLGPIGGSQSMRWYLWLTGFYGKPYFAGFPNYNLVLVYGKDGSLLSLESDMAVRDLIANKEVRQVQGGLDASFGGTRLEFDIPQTTWVAGRKLEAGWKVVTQEVDAELLRNLTRVAREKAPSQCAGFLFFRMDKEDGLFGLSSQAVIDAAGTKPIDQNIGTAILAMKTRKNIVQFQVVLWNDSDFPSRPLKLPALVQLRCSNGEFLEATEGGFDSYFWCHGFERKVAPSSFSRANCLRFMVRRLMPHERITSGIIRLRQINQDFSLYLYADVPSSTDSSREIWHDYETYPQYVAPVLEHEEYVR